MEKLSKQELEEMVAEVGRLIGFQEGLNVALEVATIKEYCDIFSKNIIIGYHAGIEAI